MKPEIRPAALFGEGAMLLACFDFRNTSHGTAFQYEGFSAIANRLGVQVESIAYDGSTEGFLTAWKRAERLMNEASAFFLPNELFLNSDQHPAQMHQRIAQDARVLVQLVPSSEDVMGKWNHWLARYDLTTTVVRIHGPDSDHPRVTVKRDADSFRDARLFQGVDEVVLSQPWAIWYGGESLPLLLCGAKAELATEWDVPTEWNGRELACMAIWYGDHGGGVLASSGPAFFDPFLPQNERLATNVIRFLCEAGTERPATPEDHCQRIEVNLCIFVLGVVRATGEDWWTARVPLTIRQKCAARQEEEKCRLPKEAYLDLIDLKTIMEKEWKLFEAHLRAEGCEGGKEKSLAWLDRLNELRRMVGHPLKKYVAGYTFSAEEKDLLAKCDELALKLSRRVPPQAKGGAP
jgi:hypothetical protein